MRSQLLLTIAQYSRSLIHNHSLSVQSLVSTITAEEPLVFGIFSTVAEYSRSIQSLVSTVAQYNRSVLSIVKIPKASMGSQTDPKRPSKESKNISFMETKLQTRARED